MKKKLLFAALFVLIALWIVTGLNPFQLLVSFVAAGALPGVTLSPYLMFALALAGGAVLVFKLSALQVTISHSSAVLEKQKVTSVTLSNSRKTSAKKRRRFTPLHLDK